MSNREIHPSFTVLMWIGVVTVLGSFVSLVVVLGYYFAAATPPVFLFWVTLFAFPIGFIFILIYIIAAVFTRRRNNRPQQTFSELPEKQ